MTDELFRLQNDARKWMKRATEQQTRAMTLAHDQQILKLERDALRKALAEKESIKLDGDWWTDAQCAAWRGESDSTFRRKLPALEAAGFPQKQGGKRYAPAIKAWAMEEGTNETTAEEEALAAIERHRLTLVR